MRAGTGFVVGALLGALVDREQPAAGVLALGFVGLLAGACSQ